jgi:hypothetical protein
LLKAFSVNSVVNSCPGVRVPGYGDPDDSFWQLPLAPLVNFSLEDQAYKNLRDTRTTS